MKILDKNINEYAVSVISRKGGFAECVWVLDAIKFPVNTPGIGKLGELVLPHNLGGEVVEPKTKPFRHAPGCSGGCYGDCVACEQ